VRAAHKPPQQVKRKRAAGWRRGERAAQRWTDRQPHRAVGQHVCGRSRQRSQRVVACGLCAVAGVAARQRCASAELRLPRTAACRTAQAKKRLRRAPRRSSRALRLCAPHPRCPPPTATRRRRQRPRPSLPTRPASAPPSLRSRVALSPLKPRRRQDAHRERGREFEASVRCRTSYSFPPSASGRLFSGLLSATPSFAVVFHVYRASARWYLL